MQKKILTVYDDNQSPLRERCYSLPDNLEFQEQSVVDLDKALEWATKNQADLVILFECQSYDEDGVVHFSKIRQLSQLTNAQIWVVNDSMRKLLSLHRNHGVTRAISHRGLAQAVAELFKQS